MGETQTLQPTLCTTCSLLHQQNGDGHALNCSYVTDFKLCTFDRINSALSVPSEESARNSFNA